MSTDLSLSRDKSVYNEHDIYMPVISSIYIPAEDIGKSTYCGTPLTKHSSAKSISTEDKKQIKIISRLDISEGMWYNFLIKIISLKEIHYESYCLE